MMVLMFLCSLMEKTFVYLTRWRVRHFPQIQNRWLIHLLGPSFVSSAEVESRLYNKILKESKFAFPMGAAFAFFTSALSSKYAYYY